MSDAGPPITVVLTDDHAMVLRGLAEFLATAGDIDIVATAASGRAAQEEAERHAPDVLLLDLLLPDQPPVQTIRAVKAVSPRTQIVILTSHEGSAYVLAATRAGAISYLLKDIGPAELIGAVRRAAAGEATISPRVAQALLAALGEEADPPLADPASLTPREIEVLGLLADAQSNAVIAETLGISGKTVKSHVSNILGKLHLSDRTAAAVYAWREKIGR